MARPLSPPQALKEDTIMMQQIPEAGRFKQQMRASLREETTNSRAITVAQNAHVYTYGDNDEMVYFIESGQIKLLMPSPMGRGECLLATCAAGDIFGESCLSGFGARRETATALLDTSLKQIPCPKFFARLKRDNLLEGFAQYLMVRIATQQQLIANLVAADSE